jgi:spermidine synthase
LVIVLEGYVVLSSELLAIRQTIPFVGSGTDTVSIIIAAVLMPLAFGYQSGGSFKPGFKKNGKYQSVRNKLIKNLMISMVILFVGLSYMMINIFFLALIELGLSNRLLMTTIYSMLFLVIPVYLLGQTIPLISNYFSKEKLSQITGKILFFSTMGSFLGAVFSTLVLMSTIGVHYTVALNFVILAGLIMLLSKKKFSEQNIAAIAIAAAAIYLNSGKMMDIFNIVENNKYNTIAFVEEEKDGEIERHLILNNNSSSMFSDSGRKHEYVETIEDIAINSIPEEASPKDILVIGAGAFTLGFEDDKNIYDYIDIDASLQELSEKLILKKPLGKNKVFHAVPARAFLTKTNKTYDVIVLDAYLGALTLPEHLVTQEFFEHVKAKLKDNGVVVANFIVSPNFENAFSRNIDNTFSSVFHNVSRLAVNNDYHVWNNDPAKQENIVYVYKHASELKESDSDIYTDNKNRVFYDKPGKQSPQPDEDKPQ